MPATFRSKGKSGVIVLGYCLLRCFKPRISYDAVLLWWSFVRCLSKLLWMEVRVLGSYRLPHAFHEKSALILWVEYSLFFAFHLSLCTNDTTFSSRVMFSFEFCSPKDFCNSSIVKTNRLFALNATRWQYFLPFTFPFYSTSNIREKIFNHQGKKKKSRLLGNIHYISHSVSMPFAHDQYTINWLIIGYRGNITRLLVPFTLADRLVIFCGIQWLIYIYFQLIYK